VGKNLKEWPYPQPLKFEESRETRTPLPAQGSFELLVKVKAPIQYIPYHYTKNKYNFIKGHFYRRQLNNAEIKMIFQIKGKAYISFPILLLSYSDPKH
jgi:hypothetical protein